MVIYNQGKREIQLNRQARLKALEPNSPKGRSVRWVAEFEENGSPHNSAIFEGSYSDGLTVEKSCESRKEASPMELNEPFSKTSAESRPLNAEI